MQKDNRSRSKETDAGSAVHLLQGSEIYVGWTFYEASDEE